MSDQDRIEQILQLAKDLNSSTATQWNVYNQSGKLNKKIVIEYNTEVTTWK